MSRKILIIALFVLVLGFLVFYFTQQAVSQKGSNGTRYSVCLDQNGKEMNCKKCDNKGGAAIVNGSGYVCEIKATDALKTCTFNDECRKGCAYPNGSASSGLCRAFKTNTYDGLGLCSRSKNEAEINCNVVAD